MMEILLSSWTLREILLEQSEKGGKTKLRFKTAITRQVLNV